MQGRAEGWRIRLGGKKGVGRRTWVKFQFSISGQWESVETFTHSGLVFWEDPSGGCLESVLEYIRP